MDKDMLRDYGIDYEKGLSRCMGDSGLYTMLLSMFRQDDCFERARKALKTRDAKAMFDCMHELKGTSGNLALNSLYELVCPLVEKLRGGGADMDEIAARFPDVELAYEKSMQGIAEILG